MSTTSDIREPARSPATARFGWQSLGAKLQDLAYRVAGWLEIAPRDLRPGVYPAARDWMTFAIYAPGKRKLALAGSFTAWKPLSLHRNRADLWWRRIRLPAGRHEYMFVAEGKTWIGDPYAREVAWTDEGPHAVLRVGAAPFTWHDAAFRLPYLRDQVLYEIHVADFSPQGTFDGVTQRLDYIKSLGVRGIELMPVFEFPTERSWGYNPAYYMAPDESYGTPDDLKRLVDEAHKRDLAVILDIVFNHSAPEHPFNLLYPYEESPWYGGGNPWGLPDFDHWKQPTKDFIRDVQHYWLHEYHVDGFRYDASAYIGWDTYNGVSQIVWSARQSKPWAYLIAEHLPKEPDLVFKTELNAEWDDTFHHQIKATLREGVFNDVYRPEDLGRLAQALGYAADGFGSSEHLIKYVENHDEERIIHEILSNPQLTREVAVQKSILSMVALAVSAGVPMLYQGQEFGMDTARTIDENKIDWERLQEPEGERIFAATQRLLWLRNTHPALRSDNFEVLAVFEQANVIVIHRWNDEGDDIVAALNFGAVGQTVEPAFPQPGEWYEYMENGTLTAGPAGTPVELQPYTGKIFTKWRNWDM